MNISQAFFILTIISFIVIYGVRKMAEYYKIKTSKDTRNFMS